MLQYIDHIVVPYVEHCQELLNDEDKAALVIMDNFKGQVTERLLSTLDANNIFTCLLPANTTDRLQPLDIAVNKPAKTFFKGKFEEWYATEIVRQLEQQTTREVIIPVDLSLPCLKVLGAQWLIE